MRDWLYFYIEFTVKRGKVFKKEPGWALGLKSNYVILSRLQS